MGGFTASATDLGGTGGAHPPITGRSKQGVPCQEEEQYGIFWKTAGSQGLLDGCLSVVSYHLSLM